MTVGKGDVLNLIRASDLNRSSPLPERAKQRVVQIKVFRSMHQRGPTGPVHVIAYVEIDLTQRLGEQDRAAQCDVHTGVAHRTEAHHGHLIGSRRDAWRKDFW